MPNYHTEILKVTLLVVPSYAERSGSPNYMDLNPFNKFHQTG